MRYTERMNGRVVGSTPGVGESYPAERPPDDSPERFWSGWISPHHEEAARFCILWCDLITSATAICRNGCGGGIFVMRCQKESYLLFPLTWLTPGQASTEGARA